MKLMTAVQSFTSQDKQNLESVRKSLEMNKEISLKMAELEMIKVEFEAMLTRNQAIWAKEKGEHEQSVNKLKTEVEQLENRKQISLTPLNARWQELEKADEIRLQKEIDLSDKLDLVDEQLEALEARLTELTEREQRASKLSAKQALEQDGINLQKEKIKQDQERFNVSLISANQEFMDRQRQLDKRELVLQARDKANQVRHQMLDQRESELTTRESQLADRYATLERNIKRYAGK